MALGFGLLQSGLINILSVYTELSQAEIDVRVRLICEKYPPSGVVAPRILAVVSAEERMERLKVIKN